ncbi:MAG: regulatory protein RecX [Candidatus Eisenbacteria sp.]|nr:regulatory protein RecX [Candidatus Eisenbacteria bacterium]
MSGTITEIRKSPGEGLRLTVFVDGSEAFTVSEEVARELGLSVGCELAPAASERLGEDDERTRAREAALRLLAVRARSEGELVDRLRRKGFGDELTAVVVSALAEVGLVDDTAFARAWADEKVRLRPIGPRRLTSELLSKRIRKELVALVVDETFREHSELELARRAVEKKVRVSGGADAAKRRARLHSFLLRRGFSYEVASTVLKEIEGDSDA